MAKKVSGDSNEMREFASRICRDYLYGPWKSVTPQNIGFKHISGGLSNLLYHISLPESLVKESKDLGEPKEVLIRVYGQTHGDGEHALEALITESVVFTLLSERGLGPKLHGVFPGGRIEQYINARPLLTMELADEKLSVKIAQKMASIHTMEVRFPIHKSQSNQGKFFFQFNSSQSEYFLFNTICLLIVFFYIFFEATLHPCITYFFVIVDCFECLCDRSRG
jgi:hypothetical protein